MLGVADYFWRLLPGNPILRRVVETGGKRRRDLFIRCGYLGFLIGVVIFSLLSSTSSFGSMSLDQLAKVSAQLFRTTSYWQLGLVAFLAPVFTAGAITQEKDSQTYDILLATPLSNAQIVLGSLLSRLFFVIALLVSGIPVFSITQVFGGVAISSIVCSFAIAAATAFVTGAIAMAIAVFKVGTRRTIFSFYLFITVYVAGLWMLDAMDYFHPVYTDPISGAVVRSNTSWFTGIHPFLALRVIFNQKEHLPPDLLNLPASLQRWPLGWYFSSPHTFYISFMFFLSFVLVSPSILFLRRLAQSSNSLNSWILQKLRISKGDKTRKPRAVWSNPIAWREAKTKASAARASILRYTFMTAGVAGSIVLLVMYNTTFEPDRSIRLPDSYDQVNGTLTIFGRNDAPMRIKSEVVQYKEPGNSEKRDVGLTQLPRGTYQILGPLTYEPVTRPGAKANTLSSLTIGPLDRKVSAERTRQFLLGMIAIEFAVILLIVTNAAASTVTREKEDGSLDLLLATPITSRYYIWGKLRGLVSFVLPLTAVPIASIFIFIVNDVIHLVGGQGFDWVVFPESLFILPGTLVVVIAFAAILGMQMSLRCRRTVMAVMSSVGIVLGICVGLALCGYSAVDSHAMGQAGLVFGAFSPFTLMTLLVDPRYVATEQFGFGTADPSNISGARLLIFVFGWAATGAYTLVVWGMYKSMVKNFDMTIRKQSR
ncbi:MAG: putative rane protein [Phycisphaerales bacterium]|nr:putative rane protein [Phycisphaerales bacterium]